MNTNLSNEPSPDAIVEGIHHIREKLLQQYGGDLRTYFESVRKRQQESGKRVVSHPPRSEKSPR